MIKAKPNEKLDDRNPHNFKRAEVPRACPGQARHHSRAAADCPDRGSNPSAQQKDGRLRSTWVFPSDWTPEMCEAAKARDVLVPVCISQVVGNESVSPVGAGQYLLSLYPDGKRPTDPIEQILIDQLALANVRLANLQLRADQNANLEAIKILNHAAVRLMGEVRRLALAIKVYRQPPSARSFAVVHQQNLAIGAAGQQNTFVDQSVGGKTEASFSSRQTEVGDKHELFGDRFAGESKEPAAGGGPEDQQLQTSTVE